MMTARRRRGVISTVLIIVVVAIIAYALVMAVSVSRAIDSYSQARQSFESAETSINEGDFVAAYSSARSALDNLSELSSELSGPQWSIAAALPIVGDDVRVAKELSATGGLLIDEAVLPILDQLESLLDDDLIADAAGALVGDENAMAGLTTRVAGLGDTLNHAADVVYECERRLNSLPESRIDKLNDAADMLREAVSTTAELLRTAEQVSDAL